MKHWGLVLVVFYALVVFILLLPAIPIAVAVSTKSDDPQSLAMWLSAGVVLAGEVLLLWLSADNSRRRLKPRTHILLSVTSTALFMAILTVGVVVCFAIALQGDNAAPDRSTQWAQVLETVSAFVVPWLIWSVVFYRLWKMRATRSRAPSHGCSAEAFLNFSSPSLPMS